MEIIPIIEGSDGEWMEKEIEDKIYFITRGLTNGKVKIYNKEHIQWAYGVALFGLGVLYAFVLLRNPESYGFVIVMLAFVLRMLYFSYANGRREAKDYIKEHKDELTIKTSDF